MKTRTTEQNEAQYTRATKATLLGIAKALCDTLQEEVSTIGKSLPRYKVRNDTLLGLLRGGKSQIEILADFHAQGNREKKTLSVATLSLGDYIHGEKHAIHITIGKHMPERVGKKVLEVLEAALSVKSLSLVTKY